MMDDQYTENWQKARADAEAKGLRIIEHGWEQHVIIDAARGLVYRYPRHHAAAAKLADEVAVLKAIHEHTWDIDLPALIAYEDTHSTYRYIPGVVLTDERVNEMATEDLEIIGDKLGKFLASFHKLDESVIAHKKTKHSTSLLEYYEGRIKSATDSKTYDRSLAALIRLKEMLDQTKHVVMHGDLHGPNVVINAAHARLQGVIDLSEMETGDPHQEFRKIFMTFPAALKAAVASYEMNGGQKMNLNKIIQWAYVNEWSNICYFDKDFTNPTYRRAYRHLELWNQI